MTLTASAALRFDFALCVWARLVVLRCAGCSHVVTCVSGQRACYGPTNGQRACCLWCAGESTAAAAAACDVTAALAVVVRVVSRQRDSLRRRSFGNYQRRQCFDSYQRHQCSGHRQRRRCSEIVSVNVVCGGRHGQRTKRGYLSTASRFGGSASCQQATVTVWCRIIW